AGFGKPARAWRQLQAWSCVPGHSGGGERCRPLLSRTTRRRTKYHLGSGETTGDGRRATGDGRRATGDGKDQRTARHVNSRKVARPSPVPRRPSPVVQNGKSSSSSASAFGKSSKSSLPPVAFAFAGAEARRAAPSPPSKSDPPPRPLSMMNSRTLISV